METQTGPGAFLNLSYEDTNKLVVTACRPRDQYLRQENCHMFEANLNNIVRPILETKQSKNTHRSIRTESLWLNNF